MTKVAVVLAVLVGFSGVAFADDVGGANTTVSGQFDTFCQEWMLKLVARETFPRTTSPSL